MIRPWPSATCCVEAMLTIRCEIVARVLFNCLRQYRPQRQRWSKTAGLRQVLPSTKNHRRTQLLEHFPAPPPAPATTKAAASAAPGPMAGCKSAATLGPVRLFTLPLRRPQQRTATSNSRCISTVPRSLGQRLPAALAAASSVRSFLVPDRPVRLRAKGVPVV